MPSLYFSSPSDRDYRIEIEDDGQTIVSFGDGQRGARLLTGQENVEAKYRQGLGLAGNVSAGSLTQLNDRPPGIAEVTNPLAASGAASPETADMARSKAQPTVRTLDRIVSLKDFEDFARGFAGIGKAQAIALRNQRTQIVQITVAAVNGGAVETSSSLYENLVKAIDGVRDPFQVVVQVDSYEKLLFNLEAKILLDARYLEAIVLDKVRQTLREQFAFEKRQFGQAVTASEAIAAIQTVEGIVAVDLDALYRLGTAKGLEQILPADSARWDNTKTTILPAQLLLLNSQGITLTPVPTR
jgi:predicted phage baseplate assembly protein